MARIALGQLNLTVGDLAGNVARMADAAARATEAGADLAVFPELAITGYPPEDLVLRGEFVRENLDALQELANKTASGCDVVTGFVDRTDAGIHNAAALLRGGGVQARYHKMQLPNFGVFDEERYFTPGTEVTTVDIGGAPAGLSICEDAWHDGLPFARYAGLPLILNINGSPYHRGKTGERAGTLQARARQTGAWIVYVNAVGGQDELVFDGGSMVVSPDGGVRHRAAMFDEDLLVVDIHGDASFADDRPGWPTGAAETYAALSLGLGDYVRQERVQPGGPGLERWHRFGAHRNVGGGCPGRRCRARRRHAFDVLLARKRGGRRRSAPSGSASASTRFPIDKVFDSYRFALAECSPATLRTSPRRTCRRACAATC